MTFDFLSYRFGLRAREAISFPRVGPANLLRGALGSALRKMACTADCPGLAGRQTRECALQQSCLYSRIFEPCSTGGPSGLADPPRPFVFRVSHLAGRSVASDEQFCFDLNFFDTSHPASEALARAFAQLARAEVVSMASESISIRLDPPSSRTNHLWVQFRTPTELKSAHNRNAFAAQPEFAVLFARARDRVSTLRSLYGPGPLDIDFRALGQRARRIRMTHCKLDRSGGTRRSGRTGQVHGLGGFTGIAEYEGELAEFLPILEAARWTGVGRHCVWGNGEILPRAILDE